ncbi:MAG: ATP-binding protein [Mycobacterium sp.]
MGASAPPAEYKQVTVLFADVVHSMDIAASVGAERLRAIMAGLVNTATAVIRRYGGTVDKFTGDGIMAVFGAPNALEDHAFRACLASIDIQRELDRLGEATKLRDGVDLLLRIGLNSGEVIVGEIGSGGLGYTAIGEQVGMAQRMESVAPPAGVMLSESTARLVDEAVVLGAPELLFIKGFPEPVSAYRLLGVGDGHRTLRQDTAMIGRQWELAALAAVLDRSTTGAGCVVCISGPPGIGKSRIVAETAAVAANRGIRVYSALCEAHASEIPFHAIARLLRASCGVHEMPDDVARAHLRSQFPTAETEDLLLLDDVLGIATEAAALPAITADARRRRLTALVNAASLARSTPAVYVVEDVHWIDQVSESMLADFLSVIPRTPSLVLITFRPEYRGALSRTPGAQAIALASLNASEGTSLVTALVGNDPSVASLTTQIAERASGNPFFAQEIVRDLVGRGVLVGARGNYSCTTGASAVSVPATLQAAIASRIDRLAGSAKRTLNAAAVIGMRFDADMLSALVDDAGLTDVMEAELVDQVGYGGRAVYAFRHPMVRTVAYESQLKVDRAELHGRLAGALQHRDPSALDENAALIAEHLEAAGDLSAAFGWHMRAGMWASTRDIVAARLSWRRARDVADRFPPDAPDRSATRIAPRTLLCASAFRVGGSGADPEFDELRGLCEAAGDKRSLAIGMAGVVIVKYLSNEPDAGRLANEHTRMLESIGDAELTVALSIAAMAQKAQVGGMKDILRLSQRVITLADGDPLLGSMIFGSPLAIAHAFRGFATWGTGRGGWKDDIEQALVLARTSDAISLACVMFYNYLPAVALGVIVSDASLVRETGHALERAERSGDDLAVQLARSAHAVVLLGGAESERDAGVALLDQLKIEVDCNRFSHGMATVIDSLQAGEMLRRGNLDGAIELARSCKDSPAHVDDTWCIQAAECLVEGLLLRGNPGDFDEAQEVGPWLDQLAFEDGLVLLDLYSLRIHAMLARAEGDDARFHELLQRYRSLAVAQDFAGHITMAEELAR